MNEIHLGCYRIRAYLLLIYTLAFLFVVIIASLIHWFAIPAIVTVMLVAVAARIIDINIRFIEQSKVPVASASNPTTADSTSMPVEGSRKPVERPRPPMCIIDVEESQSRLERLESPVNGIVDEIASPPQRKVLSITRFEERKMRSGYVITLVGERAATASPLDGTHSSKRRRKRS